MSSRSPTRAGPVTGDALWIVLVSLGSVGFSLALACAMPFAAVATLAGTKQAPRGAAALVLAAWLLNQAVGYGLLGYPRTWDSFAWGAAIGLAGLLALGSVLLVRRAVRMPVAAPALGFLAAFAVYELALLAAAAVLPSGDEAFSLPVVVWIFWTNLAALAGLAILHGLLATAGLPVPRRLELRRPRQI